MTSSELKQIRKNVIQSMHALREQQKMLRDENSPMYLYKDLINKNKTISNETMKEIITDMKKRTSEIKEQKTK